jgi:type II secretory pathway pseudopilin PulG
MDTEVGNFVAGILFFLAIIVAVIAAVVVALFKWLNRRSGQSRQDNVQAEASAVQEDYARAVTRATSAFSESKRNDNFAGIAICQKCGHAIPLSSGICRSCGTQVNQN